MTDNQREPEQPGRTDAERDLAEHERPEVGLVGDEDLPEDLRPSDDNPLAKSPGEDDEDGSDEGAKAPGMPDMGDPGAPA